MIPLRRQPVAWTGIGATKSAVFNFCRLLFLSRTRVPPRKLRTRKKIWNIRPNITALRCWLKSVINTLPWTCITSTAKLCQQPVVYDRVALPPLPVIHFYIPSKLEKFQPAVCVCVYVSHATTCTVYHGQVNNNVTAVSPVRIMKRVIDRWLPGFLLFSAAVQYAETEIENCDLQNTYDRLDTVRYPGTVIATFNLPTRWFLTGVPRAFCKCSAKLWKSNFLWMEEFYNIFSKIYLFLCGMFLFVFWIINFGVAQIFHIIKSVPWLQKG